MSVRISSHLNLPGFCGKEENIALEAARYYMKPLEKTRSYLRTPSPIRCDRGVLRDSIYDIYSNPK
ncbi:MAG: hypothetical protein QW304_09380 [Thermoproteota archaeon]